MDEMKNDGSKLSLFDTLVAIGMLILIAFGLYSFILEPTKDQQKFVAQTKISFDDFEKYACGQKETCSRYPDVLKSCAEAGSINKCVAIRLDNADYSMCTNKGVSEAFPLDVTPSAAQCYTAKLFK
jgi:hypothetical protein